MEKRFHYLVATLENFVTNPAPTKVFGHQARYILRVTEEHKDGKILNLLVFR
jgi:hypothetical protein